MSKIIALKLPLSFFLSHSANRLLGRLCNNGIAMKKINAIDLYIILNYISLVFWLLLGTPFTIVLILFIYDPPNGNLYEFITGFCLYACLFILIYALVTYLQFLSIKFAKNLKICYSDKAKYISFLVFFIANSIYFGLFENKAIAAIFLLVLLLPLMYNIRE